ncbi:MAG: hypothetical protein JWN46_490, partial [Acidimicrobiales bacterium]|nr:hypothetical protein [Acidimicrobiales bacterium]
MSEDPAKGNAARLGDRTVRRGLPRRAHHRVVPTDGEARGRLGPLGFGAVLAFTLPALGAFVSALRRPWLPVSDWALIELHVREVGTSATPLVGAYSRYGWHHPGPWPFYLLAVPYRLLGASHGLLASAALWNAALLAALAALLWTTRRDLALVALPVLAVLVHSLGAGFLSDPWNPSLPVLAIALLVAVGHRHALGAPWSGPLLAGLASLIVQLHVSLLPIVLVVAAAAVVVRHVGAPQDDRATGPNRRGEGRGIRNAVAVAAVLAVAWAPPIVDQARHRPGNITLIARYLRAPGRDLTASDRVSVGARGAVTLVERQFGVPAPWLGAHERARYLDLDSVAGRGRLIDLVPLLVAAAAAITLAVRR